jgi:hypothetical protein
MRCRQLRAPAKSIFRICADRIGKPEIAGDKVAGTTIALAVFAAGGSMYNSEDCVDLVYETPENALAAA